MTQLVIHGERKIGGIIRLAQRGQRRQGLLREVDGSLFRAHDPPMRRRQTQHCQQTAQALKLVIGVAPSRQLTDSGERRHPGGRCIQRADQCLVVPAPGSAIRLWSGLKCFRGFTARAAGLSQQHFRDTLPTLQIVHRCAEPRQPGFGSIRRAPLSGLTDHARDFDEAYF